MNEEFMELISHTLQDTIIALPLLFITYLLLELIEHKGYLSLNKRLSGIRRFAPLCAAFLGLIPQCGVSVIAAGLYVEGVISLGTLTAVFIATSDEAIPVLLAHPDQAYLLLYILATKLVFAALLGYLVDFLVRGQKQAKPSEISTVCSCHHDHNHSMLINALIRTLKIFSFLFLISFLLTWLIHEIGEQRLAEVLLSKNIFQPLIATFVGLIPNCAASVVLTQLFADGVLSFGSLIAGLSVNAGLGFMVLLKSKSHRRELWLLLVIMFIAALSLGTVFHLFI